MNNSFGSRLKNAWNVFMNRDPTLNRKDIGESYYYRPDRPRFTRGNEKTIVTSVYNRIAIDVSAVNLMHVRLDENNRFLEPIESGLNNCLTTEANIDQTGRAFVQDIVMSMLDEGCVAVVPVDTKPGGVSADTILTMRTAQILEWYPEHIRIRLYNDRIGRKDEVIIGKDKAAIIENPLFAVINEPNSTMQRLIRKLSLLDAIDEQSSAGKLDLIIQLPYIIKTEARKRQAEERRRDIVEQLAGSKYGIAYTDGTERITQLNRPLENNLMSQIEYLTNMLYSQLGISQAILDGTADEKTMLNYYDRTIEPILSAISEEMKRKFLSKTARSQLQSVEFFRDPFKLVPVSDISEIADKFTRNEIMTSNEIRQIVGMKPSDDPNADMLRNKNLNMASDDPRLQEGMESDEELDMEETDEEDPETALDDLDAQLDELEALLNDEEVEHNAIDEDWEFLDSYLQHYASPYYDPVKAHEYYMEHRELKGRRSTAGLNDEGKETARYVKKALTEERKNKIAKHKEETDKRIDSLRAHKDSGIAASKDRMNSRIDSERGNKDRQIDASKNKTDKEVKELSERKSRLIAQHSERTQSKIDKLRSALQGMSKAQKAARKEDIYKQIADLRASNQKQRQNLQAEFGEASAKTRSEHKALSAESRENFKSASSDLRSQHKDTSSHLREDFKNSSSELRSEHKAESARIKEEYDKKYEEELAKMLSDISLQKEKKTKSTSKSSSSSTINRSGLRSTHTWGKHKV